MEERESGIKRMVNDLSCQRPETSHNKGTETSHNKEKTIIEATN